VSRDVRLALETATDIVSVAAARGDTPPVTAALAGARRHAAALLPLVEQVLGELGAGPGDLSLVAVSDGPGSFTGLRVGVAVAKSLALGAGIPLWAAPSLMLRAVGAGHPGERVLAVSSALRGEVFAAAWHLAPGATPVELLAPRTLGPADLDGLPAVDRVVGEGPTGLLETLARRSGAAITTGEAGQPAAAVLLRLVAPPGGARLVREPAGWEPHYGRPAEAQVRWEQAHGRPLPDPSHPAD
jgi:tRNA threonylcarbamoyladenosine biosynthesis protein TsaB